VIPQLILTLKEKQKILVRFAKKHLGKPYKYGAKPYEAPKIFDCSSFVQYLYKKVGIDLPRTALDQASCGQEVLKKLESLEVGDLIFVKGSWGHYNPQFPGGIGHVSIYIGSGKIIHAKWQKRRGQVMEDNAKDWLTRKDVVVVKRILTKQD